VSSGNAAPSQPHWPTERWEVADHACRHCLGRVLQRLVRGVTVEVRCAQCGARADGGHLALCCCGAEAGALDYPLECFKNPHVSIDVPHEILVRERPRSSIGGAPVAATTSQRAALWTRYPREPHFTDLPEPYVKMRNR
jgi:hypothetical protein